MADELKAKGNAAIQAKNFDEAVYVRPFVYSTSKLKFRHFAALQRSRILLMKI